MFELANHIQIVEQVRRTSIQGNEHWLMAPRGPYPCYSKGLRESVRDWKQVAMLLSVKRATAARWVHQHESFEDASKQGCHRRKILNEAEVLLLSTMPFQLRNCYICLSTVGK